MRVIGLTLAALLSLVAVLRAAPLELKEVAKDAKWVIHVDVDGLRDSVVVKNAYHKMLEMHKECAKHLDKARDIIGMDPRKDLHGVTVYGKDLDKHHGVLIVHADVNQKLLQDKAAKAPDHKVTKSGSYEIHTWTCKSPRGAHPAAGAFYKNNVMVFAASVDGVKAALDVLDGKSAGITGRDAPLAGRTWPGTIFLARASAINPNTRCPVLKQAESFRVALGENKGESFYRARLAMKSTEAVEQVKSIVEGFKAMVTLARGDNADVAKLISGLKVETQDKTVRIQWSASANDVWAAIEKAGKKFIEQHKARMHGKKADSPKHGGKKADAKKGGCPVHGEKAKCHCPKPGDKKVDGKKDKK